MGRTSREDTRTRHAAPGGRPDRPHHRRRRQQSPPASPQVSVLVELEDLLRRRGTRRRRVGVGHPDADLLTCTAIVSVILGTAAKACSSPGPRTRQTHRQPPPMARPDRPRPRLHPLRPGAPLLPSPPHPPLAPRRHNRPVKPRPALQPMPPRPPPRPLHRAHGIRHTTHHTSRRQITTTDRLTGVSRTQRAQASVPPTLAPLGREFQIPGGARRGMPQVDTLSLRNQPFAVPLRFTLIEK